MPVRKYIYDGDAVLQETDGAGVVRATYTRTGPGYGDLLSQYDGTNARYYEPDGLGSTDALADDSQAVTDRWAYRAFGSATHTTGTDATPFTWVGRQGYFDDTQTGLYLLGSGTRHYDPATAQFLSNDPIGLAGGDANRRRYSANRPITHVDPSGLIKMTLLSVEKGNCGEESRVQWDFELSNGKGYDKRGYFVQKVTIEYFEVKCPAAGGPADPACDYVGASFKRRNVVQTYWEAFYVMPNKPKILGRNPGDPIKDVLFTDQFTGRAYQNSVGVIDIRGEVRFVLATDDFDPEFGKTKGGWKPRPVNKPEDCFEFKGYPGRFACSGEAPSVQDKPRFWDDGYVVAEGTARHSLSFTWVCCGDAGVSTLLSHSEGSSK